MSMSGVCRRGSDFRVISLLAIASFFFSSLALRGETPAAGAATSKALVVPSFDPSFTPGLLSEPRGYRAPVSPCRTSVLGSPYIPIDSWMYTSLTRLYSLGYLDTAFLGLRPWTRLSVVHMLEDTGAELEDAPDNATTNEAQELYDALMHELNIDSEGPCFQHRGQARVESAYTVARGITGTPLHDSYHLGETITNDYGRPYENGFDNYSGASGYATAGPFTLYARGEFQYAPSAAGYSQALFESLSLRDNVPTTTNPIQDTIPSGPISSQNNFRLMEGYVSAHAVGHEFSFGKQDQWLGPGMGGAFAYSNNAENIYSFEINRVEPLHIPLVSRLLGPFRYEFLVGSLKGHTDYRDPWTHVEKLSFKPTPDLELGFERTVIWGGEGHVPITIHSFLKSFFSVQNVSNAEKVSRSDPGARFGAFDFTWRLPYLRHWLTLYSDSEAHDDVNPISAPRRADTRPGLLLSHVPGVPKLDLRVEGVDDDQVTSRSVQGEFTYYEGEVKQGYTNKGQIFGDWMGREGKGGQAWMTYHLSGNEWVQVSWRRQKNAKDFILGGTTLDDYNAQIVKRIGEDFEVNGRFSYENYLAPIYLTGKQNVTNTSVQLTWFPKRKVSF